MPNTLCKSERLDKKKVIEKMFAGGSRSFSVFPLRVVYLPVERNRVKRQIREAYRKNKHELLQVLQDKEQQLAMAFIYLSDRLTDSAEIEERMKIALARIKEQVSL